MNAPAGHLKAYKKQNDYSYAFGAFSVYELLEARPENVVAVYVHSGYTDKEKLEAACAEKALPVVVNDRVFQRIAQKENCFVFAVFMKYTCRLVSYKPHVCLVNPSDMGNLGCILRSMAAFGVNDMSIITPASDVFDPKTVRASMGALFKVNVMMFPLFSEYAAAFPKRTFYPFMTDGAYRLGTDPIPRPDETYTLIFGNEATGLPESFAEIGYSLRIPQSSLVDSLNLSVAVGVGLYEFSRL